MNISLFNELLRYHSGYLLILEQSGPQSLVLFKTENIFKTVKTFKFHPLISKELVPDDSVRRYRTSGVECAF